MLLSIQKEKKNNTSDFGVNEQLDNLSLIFSCLWSVVFLYFLSEDYAMS